MRTAWPALEKATVSCLSQSIEYNNLIGVQVGQASYFAGKLINTKYNKSCSIKKNKIWMFDNC